MQHKDYYTYPAVVSFDDDGISIEFPDIPGCFSCVELDCPDIPLKIARNAREAMGLHLFSLEVDGDPIPEPSDILSAAHESNQAVILVDVWMPPIRERQRNKNVNKMCTVPSWLALEAENEGLNFSHTLQEGLMAKLGIKPVRRKHY